MHGWERVIATLSIRWPQPSRLHLRCGSQSEDHSQGRLHLRCSSQSEDHSQGRLHLRCSSESEDHSQDRLHPGVGLNKVESYYFFFWFNNYFNISICLIHLYIRISHKYRTIFEEKQAWSVGGVSPALDNHPIEEGNPTWNYDFESQSKTMNEQWIHKDEKIKPTSTYVQTTIYVNYCFSCNNILIK